MWMLLVALKARVRPSVEVISGWGWNLLGREEMGLRQINKSGNRNALIFSPAELLVVLSIFASKWYFTFHNF